MLFNRIQTSLYSKQIQYIDLFSFSIFFQTLGKISHRYYKNIKNEIQRNRNHFYYKISAQCDLKRHLKKFTTFSTIIKNKHKFPRRNNFLLV